MEQGQEVVVEQGQGAVVAPLREVLGVVEERKGQEAVEVTGVQG